MSIPPTAATVRSTNDRQLSSSMVSSSKARSASMRSTRRAPPTTRAPASRNFRTVAAPMPLDAPVTTAVFPARLTASAMFLVLCELDGLDDDGIDRSIARVALDRRDPVDDVLARDDIAEDGVLAVEP